MEEIRQRRERQGLSRIALSRLSGVNAETIRRIEEGLVSKPHIGTTHKLEHALQAAESRGERGGAA